MNMSTPFNIVILICGIAIAALVSLTDASPLRDDGSKPLKELEEYEKPWWAGHHKYNFILPSRSLQPHHLLLHPLLCQLIRKKHYRYHWHHDGYGPPPDNGDAGYAKAAEE